MIKKIIIFISIMLFVNACDYKPLYSTNNVSNFNIVSLEIKGDKNINNFLDYMYVYKKKVYYSAEEYTYDHSSQIFMFYKEGDFFGTISLNESNKNIYKKIDRIVNGA